VTLNDYLPVLLLTVVVAIFAVFSFVASNLLAPRHPTPAKLSPYESGIEPVSVIGNEPFPSGSTSSPCSSSSSTWSRCSCSPGP